MSQLFKLIKPYLIILFSIFLYNSSLAQNALDFDGVDDKISIPNASFYVTNSDMSILKPGLKIVQVCYSRSFIMAFQSTHGIILQ